MDGKQKSVAAITQELQNCSEEALIALCSNLRTDPRKSVQLLAEKAMKRLEKEIYLWTMMYGLGMGRL